MSAETTTIKFNEVEERILKLLEDGKNHSPNELLMLVDPLADRNYLRQVIFLLRQKLKPMGHDIIGQALGRGVAYRRVLQYPPVNTEQSSGT